MKLDNEDTGKGLKLVPETYGMNVPSSCTIVIIAGKWRPVSNVFNFKFKFIKPFSSLGKFLDKVDRVMTQVDRITEDIAHMPVAAFIFRDKESDEVHYSFDIRYLSWKLN